MPEGSLPGVVPVNDPPRLLIGHDLNLLLDAAKVAVSRKFTGPASIQRRVRVGFVKAQHLTLLLAQEGIIDRQPDGRGHRVLIQPDGLDVALDRIREAAGKEVQPARLRQAREYIGFTRDQAACAVGTDPLALADIEDGAAEPTGAMLEKLSRLYRRPVSWFTGEFKFEPGRFLVCGTEDLTDGDREAMLDFAEFLACKKALESGPQPEGSAGG